MSNHFTYEVDERNLRLQLKEFTIPVSEEAWQKFETFSDSMINEHSENRFNAINFKLNRNIILPSVFGVIIILFSFLLVNFVSIKTSGKENSKNEETTIANENTNKSKQAEEKIVPVAIKKTKSETEPVQTISQKTEPPKQEKTVAVTETPKEPSKQESITGSSTAVITAATTNTASAVNSAENITDSVANAAMDEEAKAKRRAKRRAEAIETQKLQEIRPTPVMEERDAEIRPN